MTCPPMFYWQEPFLSISEKWTATFPTTARWEVTEGKKATDRSSPPAATHCWCNWWWLRCTLSQTYLLEVVCLDVFAVSHLHVWVSIKLQEELNRRFILDLEWSWYPPSRKRLRSLSMNLANYQHESDPKDSIHSLGDGFRWPWHAFWATRARAWGMQWLQTRCLELRSKGIGLPTLQGDHTDMMNYVTSSPFVFKDMFQTYSKKDWKNS